MKHELITVERYADLFAKTNVAPMYQPQFVEYFFSQLDLRPKIIGIFHREHGLIAALPVLQRQLFPNSLHRRSLRRFGLLGDIGQPEGLFPVLDKPPPFHVYYISPTTSPLLEKQVRGIKNWSIRSIGIAKHTKHKEPKRLRRLLFEQGGEVVYSEQMTAEAFADIYIDLHADRWSRDIDAFKYVKKQIIHLYEYVHGAILFDRTEPIAAQLCFRSNCHDIYYVDFVNIGVKSTQDKRMSYGSILMLCVLEHAQEQASAMDKTLRFSFGYQQEGGYKKLWAKPEKTYVGF